MTAEELGQLIFDSLDRAPTVEIDGLGTFRKDAAGRISLRKSNRTRVFIAYAVEDAVQADRLYRDLAIRGFSPWLDRRKLLPGQHWPRRIQEAIENADYFLPCFSHASVRKRGGFQVELRYALDCACRVPLDDTFIVPVRLDGCRVPARITRETQYIDLFPDWRGGLASVVQAMESRRLKAA